MVHRRLTSLLLICLKRACKTYCKFIDSKCTVNDYRYDEREVGENESIANRRA